MLEPTLVPGDYAPFRQPAYGLGVMIDALSPYGLVAGHGGGGPGYSIGAFHFADVNGRSVTSVVLANRDQDDIGLQIAFSSLMSWPDLRRNAACYHAVGRSAVLSG